MALAGSTWVRTQPYKPGQTAVYKLSRSKIELFMDCPACFWLDRRLKIGRPDSPPFQINKAVDELFKKEFDTYRKASKPHPMMVENGVDAVPFSHDDLNKWRENFVGVQYLHEPTNLMITGAIDDVWVNPEGQLIVVDYKATAKKSEVSIDAPWQISYKRQLEVYQWLLRRNGFDVSDTGYFVYTNGRLDLDGFFDKVEFVTKLIPYTGNDEWIEPTLLKMKEALESDTMPKRNSDCKYCSYAEQRVNLYREYTKK
jgi:CRISPR/Cas system-associated exonuclease Cas4 (RecB family)